VPLQVPNRVMLRDDRASVVEPPFAMRRAAVTSSETNSRTAKRE